jgi:ATP-dependent Lon protease
MTLTGHLGKVMQESMQAALSWVRAHADTLGIDSDFFKNNDLHLHVPAGAIPKDGPSAGITVVTALASLLTDRRVRPYLSMTGEVTLSGLVLPVGGIKEKVLAARRAGIRTVVLPRLNERDLEDIAKELRKDITYVFADTVADVLRTAIIAPNAKAATASRKASPMTAASKAPARRAKRKKSRATRRNSVSQ